MLKAMSKFHGVLKMFMLGMLKTILKTVLKYEKNTITLYGTCWNWVADFVFLLQFCMSNWSETYRKLYNNRDIRTTLRHFWIVSGWQRYFWISVPLTHNYKKCPVMWTIIRLTKQKHTAEDMRSICQNK